MMSNPIRSNSYFESVKSNLDPDTIKPIARTHLSATTGNVNRISLNDSITSDSSSRKRFSTVSASNNKL